MVNEQIVRGTAVQVCVLALLSLGLSFSEAALPVSAGLVIFLCADFILRTFGGSRYSLPAMTAKRLNGLLFRFQKRMITARPKNFAAGIGMIMTAAGAVMWYLRLVPVMRIFLAVLALFSFLEAAFRFCAGCKIFALLIRLGILGDDACTDCVLPGGDGI